MTHCKPTLLQVPDGEISVFNPSRRRFLRTATAAIATASSPAFAQTSPDFWNLPREIWLHRMSTGEQVRAVYWADGQLVADGYTQLCILLRDVQANSPVQMDITLLDILRGTYGWFRAFNINRPLLIHSGYRTLKTNANTEGAVRNSMHLYGKAADLHMQGVPASYVAQLGQYLGGGGVGYYATKNFVHIDSGRLRTWVG